MSLPFDQQGKLLLEEEERLVLHIFGALPLDAPAEVTHLDREVNLGARRVDHAYRVSHNGRTSIEHFEITTNYRHVRLDDVCDYSLLLELKYKLPVTTRIVLMTAQSMPADPPRQHRIHLGGSSERIHDVNFVRVWELPASVALGVDRQASWPWVMLMNANRDELEESMRRVAITGSRELISGLAVLCGLRYGKEGAWRILEFMNNLITREMMRESSVVQTWIEEGVRQGLEQGVEKGVAKGIEKGKELGRRESTLRFLRMILQTRFGAVPDSLDERVATATPDELEALGERALRCSSLDDFFGPHEL